MLETKRGALLAPQRAVIDVQGRRQVAVVTNDDTVNLRTIQVADRVGSLSVVTEGPKAGERIVVEGIEKATAGEKVKTSLAEASK